jgi:hypothetical protein
MTAQGQPWACDPLRFIVLQPGARMNYAVPALLARAGMLERFYTDICADVGLLRHLGPLWPERIRPRPVARLLGRRLRGRYLPAPCDSFLSRHSQTCRCADSRTDGPTSTAGPSPIAV